MTNKQLNIDMDILPLLKAHLNSFENHKLFEYLCEVNEHIQKIVNKESLETWNLVKSDIEDRLASDFANIYCFLNEDIKFLAKTKIQLNLNELKM